MSDKKQKTITINGHKFIKLAYHEEQVVGFMPDGSTYTYKASISPRRKGKMTNIKA